MKTYLHKLVMVVFFQLALCPFFAHASCFNVQPLHNFYAEQGRKVSYGGHFSSLESALSHVQSVAATHGGSPSYSNVNTGNGTFQVAYVSYYTPDGNLFYYTTWNIDNPVACETDTDGDGLPDKCDAYPDDPTPYSVKLMAYFTEDGTPDGAHTYEIWKTDRPGEYFYSGEEPASHHGGFFIRHGTWIDPADACGEASGTVGPAPPSEYTGQPSTHSTGAPDGNAQENTGTGFEDGDPGTGDQTDNEALVGIQSNTSATAKNVKRLGDYLSDINKTVQTMDRTLAQMAGNDLPQGDQSNNEDLIAKLDEMRASDQATSETGKTALENFDIETALGDNISGELVEGEDGDYQKPGDLIEETWVQEALNTNPIKTALSNSGFTYGSSSATATLDLGYLGTHTLDIQPLEPGFILFGNLLVGMVTLAGFVYVATGRGF